MKKIFLLLLIAAVFIFSACNNTDYEPVDIDPLTDICIQCNMHVPDDMFGVEFIMKDGKVYKFDDLGCMMKYSKSIMDDIEVLYVRDYNTEEWIDATKAIYVYDKDIRTPMGNGVISFQNKTDAEEFVESNGTGEIFDYEALLEFEWPAKSDS